MNDNLEIIREVNLYLTNEQNEIFTDIIKNPLNKYENLFEVALENQNTILILKEQNILLDYYNINIFNFGIININRLVKFGEILSGNKLENNDGIYIKSKIFFGKVKEIWVGAIFFILVKVKKVAKRNKIQIIYVKTKNKNGKKNKKIYNDAAIYMVDKVKPTILSGGLPSLGKKK